MVFSTSNLSMKSTNTESASSSLPTQRENRPEKMVCLRCFNDELLEIDEATARQSQTLANFLQGDDYVGGNTGGEFEVKDSSRGTLEKVFEYCKKHIDGDSSSDEELRSWDAQFMKSNCFILYEVILAADYLGIKSLVGLCCQTIADRITACKTPSEIRAKFNIINDFTPEEQEHVCTENQWAFEADDVPFELKDKYPSNILRLRARLRGGQDPNSIHDGLIEDIFTIMPAKSLARCRCVSRAWASIIRRPSFSALFSSQRKPQLLFACSEQETNDGKLFFLSSPLPQALEDFSSVLEVNQQTKLSLLRGEDETDISVNGLVFAKQEQPVRRGFRGPGKCFCVIHNPSTGKSITLPELCPVAREDLELRPGVLGTQTYFGYDPIDKVYKALSMTTATNGIVRDHQCLTVRGGNVLWRSIKCCIQHFLHRDPNQVCINGHIFYPAADRVHAEISIVIDFDVNSEKFTYIKYFDTQLSKTPWKDGIKYMATLFDFNGKLGSYVTVDHMESFELWVLDDAVNHSWSKQFHELPNLGADCNFLYMRFAGVTHRNETVLLPLIHDTGPLFVWFYNTHTKTVKKICFKSSSVFEGKRFRTSVNHIECLKTPWEEFKGVAVLESSEGVNGTIVFTQEGEAGVTTMTVTVSGLKLGLHCISIHNVDMKEFHVGNDGNATFTTGDDDCQISLTGPNSISGRSVILKADGRVVAQGDIGLQD